MTTRRVYSALRAAGVGGVLGLLAACAAHKAPPPSSEIDETSFRDYVRVLASDEFEGRKPGTPGEEKTLTYLVAQLRKLGLKPGNGDSYLQPVPLVELSAVSDPILAVSGGRAVKPFAYGKDMMIWTPREVQEASLHRSEMVFVGYGIVAPEYQWNDYAGLDVHGKTVLVMVNDPGYGTKDPKVFKGNAETYYGRWTYKVEEAAREGASGVLLIHDTGAAGCGWDTVVNGRAGPQLESVAADGNASRAAVEGWISAAAADALFAQAGLDFGALRAAAARPGF